MCHFTFLRIWNTFWFLKCSNKVKFPLVFGFCHYYYYTSEYHQILRLLGASPLDWITHVMIRSKQGPMPCPHCCGYFLGDEYFPLCYTKYLRPCKRSTRRTRVALHQRSVKYQRRTLWGEEDACEGGSVILETISCRFWGGISIWGQRPIFIRCSRSDDNTHLTFLRTKRERFRRRWLFG